VEVIAGLVVVTMENCPRLLLRRILPFMLMAAVVVMVVMIVIVKAGGLERGRLSLGSRMLMRRSAAQQGNDHE
jgi:hypothetical protein